MHWQKIIDTYNSLPEDERTSVRIAAQLRDKGQNVYASRVCDVLKQTVLEDCIDSSDVRATAKVLRTLVDFTIIDERSDSFDEDITFTIERVLNGLGSCSGDNYEAIGHIRYASSHIMIFYSQVQQRHEGLPASYYNDKGRYILSGRIQHPDDDIPY